MPGTRKLHPRNTGNTNVLSGTREKAYFGLAERETALAVTGRPGTPTPVGTEAAA